MALASFTVQNWYESNPSCTSVESLHAGGRADPLASPVSHAGREAHDQHWIALAAVSADRFRAALDARAERVAPLARCSGGRLHLQRAREHMEVERAASGSASADHTGCSVSLISGGAVFQQLSSKQRR